MPDHRCRIVCRGILTITMYIIDSNNSMLDPAISHVGSYISLLSLVPTYLSCWSHVLPARRSPPMLGQRNYDVVPWVYVLGKISMNGVVL